MEHVTLHPRSEGSVWTRCSFRRHQTLAPAGAAPEALFLLSSGWACNVVVLRDGRRQITDFYLPGDLCDPQWALAGGIAGASVVALTSVSGFKAPLPLMARLIGGSGKAARSFLDAILQRMERQNDRIVSLGRKSATERIGSLLQELYSRCTGHSDPGAQRPCDFPLTQADLADATGLIV